MKVTRFRDPQRLYVAHVTKGQLDWGIDVVEYGQHRPLNPRNDLVNHSPDGVVWGYAGSGPAQAALGILADAVGDRKAVIHHQEFKRAFLARYDKDTGWTLPVKEVRQWVKSQDPA